MDTPTVSYRSHRSQWRTQVSQSTPSAALEIPAEPEPTDPPGALVALVDRTAMAFGGRILQCTTLIIVIGDYYRYITMTYSNYFEHLLTHSDVC